MAGKFPRVSRLAERLVGIQKALGYRSIREFTEALLEAEFWKKKGLRPPSVSQETIRQYHSPQDRRDPPSSYLLAVVERFEVNPTWLLTGEGGLQFMEDVRRAERATVSENGDPLWPAAREGAPMLRQWPTPARMLFLDMLRDYAHSFEGWQEVVDGLSKERRFQAWEALARDLDRMLNVRYWSITGGLSRREYTQYLVSLIHAVQLRIPDPGEGPHVFLRFETLDPENRATLAGFGVDVDRPLTTEVEPSLGAMQKYGR